MPDCRKMEIYRVQGIGTSTAGVVRLAVAAGVLIISGCTVYPAEPVAPEPEIVAPPEPVVVEPEPAPPPPAPAPAKPKPLPTVAIVLTGRQPAYESVANELAGRLENFTIYDLSDRSQPPVAAFRLINDSNSNAVVAIGLRAAKSSLSLAQVPVIFSQVFNYQEHNLVTGNSRGVSSLAPLDAHLAAWKKVDPTLARVGMIIGAGHDELVSEAEIAAEKYGVDLVVQVTSSDQETLYHFKRIIREIDGFWLFPDNRVLSPRVLKDMLSQANRRQVPVAVSHEAMLSMGAAISVSSVASDIAATIIDVLMQINAGNIDDVPPLSGLSEVRVVTNDALLQQHVSADSESLAGGSGSQ
jgi:ABC-type uncharacterized transport system substrate-binding protein